MAHFRRSLCAVLTVGALVGCSPQPAASPTPSPSSSPTPSPTASEQALFAEAERVFKAQYAALLKYSARGGADSLPAEFNQWTTGTYRAEMTQFLGALKQSGERFVGPSPKITIRPGTGLVMADSRIAILACVDSSKSKYRKASGSTYFGSVDVHTAFFKEEGGRLKLFENRIEEVASCPA